MPIIENEQALNALIQANQMALANLNNLENTQKEADLAAQQASITAQNISKDFADSVMKLDELSRQKDDLDQKEMQRSAAYQEMVNQPNKIIEDYYNARYAMELEAERRWMNYASENGISDFNMRRKLSSINLCYLSNDGIMDANWVCIPRPRSQEVINAFNRDQAFWSEQENINNLAVQKHYNDVQEIIRQQNEIKTKQEDYSKKQQEAQQNAASKISYAQGLKNEIETKRQALEQEKASLEQRLKAFKEIQRQQELERIAQAEAVAKAQAEAKALADSIAKAEALAAQKLQAEAIAKAQAAALQEKMRLEAEQQAKIAQEAIKQKEAALALQKTEDERKACADLGGVLVNGQCVIPPKPEVKVEVKPQVQPPAQKTSKLPLFAAGAAIIYFITG